MSGPSRQAAEHDDPACDPGVLEPLPVCEFNGLHAVRRHGGCAVLPWRAQHLEAVASGLETVPRGELLRPAAYRQALVRVAKGRATTYADLAHAWTALSAGGRLLVSGGNDVGITSWCRRLAQETDRDPIVLANHSHARVVSLIRPDRCPGTWTKNGETAAGLFQGGALDAGTAVLLDHLVGVPTPNVIVDLGCGAGHLGWAVAGQWPQAQVWYLDADARAIDHVARLIAGAPDPGRQKRSTVAWWDASETIPVTGVDLVLCNPPCHAGTAVDLTTARLMFRAAAHALRPQGRLLVVANRKLPYEADLARLGSLACLDQRQGFKILSMTRPG